MCFCSGREGNKYPLGSGRAALQEERLGALIMMIEGRQRRSHACMRVCGARRIEVSQEAGGRSEAPTGRDSRLTRLGDSLQDDEWQYLGSLLDGSGIVGEQQRYAGAVEPRSADRWEAKGQGNLDDPNQHLQ